MHRSTYQIYLAVTLAIAGAILSAAGPANFYQQTRALLQANADPRPASDTEAIDAHRDICVPP
jgi:hypothetical protein